MKKQYYLLVASVVFVSVFAVLQTDSGSYDKENRSLEAKLEKWDPVRGTWLAESLEAMKENKTIPDRMFPEDLTPYQMISLLPNDLRKEVERSFVNNEPMQTNTEARLPSDQDQEISRPRPLPQMNQSDCNTISARSYGDPHLVTFDRARYSFQTVGEFVLTRSHAGMEVQTRQSPEKGDFSFNTAVAMNVGGDRVGIYARNIPDNDRSTPLRVNGRPIQIATKGKYFLPYGGIIRRTTSTEYTVYWPTGEILHAKLFNLSSTPSMNLNMTVTECGSYDGLLGNANGVQSDDFGQSQHQASIYVPSGDIFSGSSEEIERSRLTYIANALGDRFRVKPSTSLFDYPPGSSTYTFTDRNFPRVHRTVEEIPETQKEEARKVCERSGVSEDDMNGCIFDQAYLEIEPAPERRKEDPTEGMVLRPVDRPQPNVNSGPIRPTITGGSVTNGTQDRPSMEPQKDDRVPFEDVRNPDPKDEADKEAQLRQERIAEQYRLEEEERERQREERIREQEAQDRMEREASEKADQEREDERLRRNREVEERAEQEARDRENREREEAERLKKEQREQAAQEKREREERERVAKRKAEEQAKAEADRKRQEEVRRKAAADKKAREEAARKAKEAAERKRQEEAAKKTRSGGR